MAKLGERPAECNQTRYPSLTYRLNKARAKIHNLFIRKGLNYRALNSEKSMQAVLQSEKSFIRFGDAESKLALGGDWPTQRWDKHLASGIRRIFENYSPKCRYLIGVANSRLTMSVRDLKRINRHRTWRNSRYLLNRYLTLNRNLPFLEANLFRVGPDGLDRKNIERLWIHKAHVVIVHNHSHYLVWFREKYPFIDSHFIQIPEKNFFNTLQKTKHDIMTLIRKQNFKMNRTVILISAGAGGKILNYQLCQENADYLCYDMGNFFHMQRHRKSVMAELQRRHIKMTQTR